MAALSLMTFPMVAGGLYNLSVDYGGVFYGRSLPPNGLSEEVLITVYEATGGCRCHPRGTSGYGHLRN